MSRLFVRGYFRTRASAHSTYLLNAYVLIVVCSLVDLYLSPSASNPQVSYCGSTIYRYGFVSGETEHIKPCGIGMKTHGSICWQTKIVWGANLDPVLPLQRE